jgi:predicted acyl esterase
MFWALFLHVQDAQDIRDNPEAQEKVWDGLRNIRKLLQAMPFKRGDTPLSMVPQLENVLFDYYYRGEYDEFWAGEVNDVARHFERHADIPGTFTGGWFDPFHTAMTEYYAAMAAKNRTYQRLIMGPWTHVGMRGQVSNAGDVDFGTSAIWGVRHYFEEQLRWFDRWLRDQPNGVDEEAPVQIFVMGGGDGHRTAEGKLFHGGQWRGEKEWPLARTQSTPFYLHGDGSLRQDVPAVDAPPLQYDFDPEHPVPTIGGALAGIMELPADDGGLDAAWRRFVSPVARLRHVVTIGSAHQKETPQIFGARAPYPLLADRSDVLVFQTAPLQTDVEITGPAKVRLWISSSAIDTDFTAKLVDVYPSNEDYPEGYHMFLCDSIIRARFRNGWEKEEMMEPGQIYAVEIRLPPTSNLFLAGHRIRVDISSSNFPRLDVNPNTGEAMGRHTHTVVACNSVYMDAEHPSFILLPIIPHQ